MKFRTEFSFELLNFNWPIVCLLLGDGFFPSLHKLEDKNLVTTNVFQNPIFPEGGKNVITCKWQSYLILL